MTATDLERNGTGGLCDVPQVRTEAGRSVGATTILILNGMTAYWYFDVGSLCSWRADEVELVEFGTDVCRDATQTIVDIVNSSRPGNIKPIVCSGRSRSVPRHFVNGGQGALHTSGLSYVIIWEKR